jgi:signal transduction histidine kinase
MDFDYDEIIVLVDSLVAISMIFLAGLSLLRKGYKNPLNRIYLLLSVSMAVFIISGDISNNIEFPTNVSMIANFLSFPAGYGCAILLAQLVAYLADLKVLNHVMKIMLWPLWAICLLGATPLVVAGVKIQSDIYAVNYGPLVWLFFFGAITAIILMVWGIVGGLIRASDPEKKKQLLTTSLGLIVAVPMIFAFSLAIPLLTGSYSYNLFGSTPALILSISLYYSVVRYHLFDIRLAVVRSLAYILSLGIIVAFNLLIVVSASSIFTQQIFSVNQIIIGVVILSLTLLVYDPIKNFFNKLAGEVFYRDYYGSDSFFARINKIITSTISLRGLLERIASEISATLRSEQVFFFINTSNGHYVSAGTGGHTKLSKDDVLRLHGMLRRKRGVVVAPMLESDDPLYVFMSNQRIEVIVPLLHNDIVGYLFLGRRRGSHYKTRDINILSTIADELVIAIQNSQSVDAVRESNMLLRQIDRQKDDFVSVASHELRTPMTVIRGFINLLEREQLGPVNDSQKEVLDKMSKNTKTLIDLVNDMLDLSKLEANKLEVVISDNQVSVMINNCIEKMKLMYDSKDIKLSHYGPDLLVKADTDKFERVVLNLLSNAYKFTSSGGSVTVSSSVNSENNTATICVCDNGIGIPADAIDNLFKKFSQIDNYLQRQSGGTGLGLAICRQLVEKMGGEIHVESTVGVGSKFYFTLPLADSKKSDH